tara:strand:- start:3025 stop:3378 length:354 start_codon:yes stop_codon:yes gene_type:complete
MKYLIILLAAMSVGCSTMEQKAHSEALNNFTYVSDNKLDRWDRYDTANPFSGDCEDFSFSLQSVIGGKVYRVRLYDGQYHAVLLKNGVVYDNLYKHPKSKLDYPATFESVMNYPKVN